MLDPTITSTLTSLAEVAARNTAGIIQTRVSAAKATSQHEQTVSELSEIINQLVEDRVQLVGIATALREELVAQQITSEDIEYITSKLIPAAERLMELSGNENDQTIEAVKALVSVELLTTLQLVGFNFKEAIGEPLTAVVQAMILRAAGFGGASSED